MTNRQQSVFFTLIVFFFAAGAALLIYSQYQIYLKQKTDLDTQAGSYLVTQPKK